MLGWQLTTSNAARAEPVAPAAGPAAAAAYPAPAPIVALTPEERLLAAARKYFPSDDTGVSKKRLFRLTRDQIDLTVGSLLPGYVTRSVKEAMPRDPLQTNYEYAELLAINASNSNAFANWAGEIAANVRKKPEGVVNCAAQKNSETCLAKAAVQFILKAYRADAADERMEKIVRFYLAGVKNVGFAQATGDLVEIVLNSPDFLFRKEIEVDRNRRLTALQLLQSLTYTLADAPPEKLGFSSVGAAGHLFKPADADKTIATIVASKEAREKLVRFFLTWLEIKDPAGFTISAEIFPEFNAKLANAMVEETTRYLQTQLAKPEPKLADITQSTSTYVSSTLQPIYQTAAADTAGAKLVNLDASQRLGIFSQPAVLASHSGPTNTRPIKRGVFWVRKVMCMELEPPPNGIDSTLDETLHTTERQRIEHATKRKACVGCHKLIDPLGFFQESYDALGRWRTTDNGFPVDPKIEIKFLDEGPSTAATPVEALKTFTSSLMFKQCFVRQLFRFYMGRGEEPADDPLLRQAFLALANDDNILDVVKIIASSERLGRRQ